MLLVLLAMVFYIGMPSAAAGVLYQSPLQLDDFPQLVMPPNCFVILLEKFSG